MLFCREKLRHLTFAVALCAVLAWMPGSSASQVTSDETARLEAADRDVYERFLAVLKQRPRTGTALDRVYAFHVERGTVDSFLAELRSAANETPAEGGRWMLLAVCEQRRGNDAAAETAFKHAEQLLPRDPVAAWYHARTLIAMGRYEPAVAALNRALSLTPERSDLLDISMELGRTLLRLQRPDEALQVWRKLESQFPDDLRIAERIATELADQGQADEAIARLQSLAQRTADRFQSTQFAIRATELQLAAGHTIEARGNLEGLLKQLRPQSWLFKDVRSRIERIVRQSGDANSVVTYYEQWLQNHPDDLDALLRLATAYSSAGRITETGRTLTAAVQVAPGDVTVRRTLIDHLVQVGDVPAALVQNAELAVLDPRNPDQLQRWGMLQLKDDRLSPAERQQRAMDIWKQLLIGRQNDPITVRQVADLHRRGEIIEPALTLYRQAIDLAPTEDQYREVLGEYLHSLKRTDEAVAVWKSIAEEDRRTTQNLVRLADIFAHAGMTDLAISAMQQACQLEPEFRDRLKFAQLLADADRFDDAIQQLDLAESLVLPSTANQASPTTTDPASRRKAESDLDEILTERIQTLSAAGRLESFTAELARKLATNGATQAADAGSYELARQWYLLTMCRKSLGQVDAARDSLKVALTLAPDSIGLWTASAELAESSGEFGDAIKSFQRLIKLDARTKPALLQKIALIQQTAEQTEQSLQTGRELLTVAPGNPAHYRFYAELCRHAGRTDEALDALRRASRIDPTDTTNRLALANALADDFRTAEAIEVLWQVFEMADGDVVRPSSSINDNTTSKSLTLSDDLDSVVRQLADLYLRMAQFEQLIERLTPQTGDLATRRKMAMARSVAYLAAGDLRQAHDAVRSIVDGEITAPELLQLLLSLAVQANDAETAVSHARRLFEFIPSDAHRNRLSELLTHTGTVDDLEGLWLHDSSATLPATGTEPWQLISAIDGMIELQRYDAAAELCRRMTARNPQNWESLFRSGVICWKQDDRKQACEFFRTVFALDLPVATPSAAAIALSARKSGTAFQSAAAAAGAGAQTRSPNALAVSVYETGSLLPEMSEFDSSAQSIVNDCLQTSETSSTAVVPLLPSRGYVSVLQSLDRFSTSQQAAIALLTVETLQTNSDDHLVEWIVAHFAETTDANLLRIAWFMRDRIPSYHVQFTRTFDFEALCLIAEMIDRFPQPEALWLQLACMNDDWSSLVYLENSARSAESLKLTSNGLLANKRSELCADALNQLLIRRPEWLHLLNLNHGNGIFEWLKNAPLGGEKLATTLREISTHSISRNQIQSAIRIAAELDQFDLVRTLLRRLNQLTQDAPDSASAKERTDLNYWYEDGQDTLLDLMETLASANDWDSLSLLLSGLYSSCRHQLPQHPGAVGKYVEMPWEDRDYLADRIISLYSAANRLGELRILLEELRSSESVTECMDRDFLRARVEAADGNLRAAIAIQVGLAERLPKDWKLLVDLVANLAPLGESQLAASILDRVELTSKGWPAADKQDLAIGIVAALSRFAEPDQKRILAVVDQLLSQGMRQSDRSREFPVLAGITEGLTAPFSMRPDSRIRPKDRLTSLLTLLRRSGRTQGTKPRSEVAYEILRRTNGLPTSQSPLARDSAAFEEALKAIAGTKLLDALIHRAELQVSSSSDPVFLWELLAEYYVANGNIELEQHAVEQYARLTESAPQQLLDKASQLESNGKPEEACDVLLECLRLAPDQFAEDFETHLQSFEHAKRVPDLGRAVLASGLARTQAGPKAMISLAATLRKAAEDSPHTRQLINGALAASQHDLFGLLESIGDHQLISSEELTKLIMAELIPDNSEVSDQPWAGSFDERGIELLLKQCGSFAERSTILRQLDAALDGNPGWAGGKVLKSLVLYREGQLTEATEMLFQLLDDTTLVMPGLVASVTEQAIQSFGWDTERLRISLLTRTSHGTLNFDKSSRLLAIHELIALHRASHRRNEVRELQVEFHRLSGRSESRLIESMNEWSGIPAVDCLRSIGREYSDLMQLPLDEAHAMQPKLAAHCTEVMTSFDAPRVTEWLQDCLNRPDTLAADNLFDLLPVVEPFQIREPITPEQLSSIKLRSLLLTAINGARQRPDSHAQMIEVIRKIMAAEDVDACVLMMCLACPLAPEDHELQAEIAKRLLLQLEQDDKVAAADLASRNARLPKYATVQRDVSFATMAQITSSRKELQHLTEPFLRRAVNAARIWGDEWKLAATLNSCEATARAAGLTDFADQLAAESAENLRVRIERRDMPGFELAKEVRTRLLKP